MVDPLICFMRTTRLSSGLVGGRCRSEAWGVVFVAMAAVIMAWGAGTGIAG